MAPMQHVPASDLTSLPKRIAFTSSFLSFTEADGNAIQTSGPLIAHLLQDILDSIYSHLLSYDTTAKAFVPKTANDAEVDREPARMEDLHLEHGHITRQMNFLRNCLLKIVKNADWTPDSRLFQYMDQVGVMHTGAPGFKHREKKPEVRVEYMHLGILLGRVVTMIVDAVMKMEEIDAADKSAVLQAWNKLMWIQNDLFARHYVVDLDTGEQPAKLAETGGKV